MSILKFSDGEEFDTSGEYRIEERFDGLYVLGHGFFTAVADQDEGLAMIARLSPTKTTPENDNGPE